MALRSGHGKGAGVPRVECLPADELPAGVPGPARLVPLRDAAGRLLPGPGTSALAREGAKAAHESRQLAALLGLWIPADDHPFAPYAKLAREWRDEHMAELARTVAGGEVGPGPASVVSTAALQLAASRWLFDKSANAGDAKGLLEATRLADSSRQNLLAAHELAAKEAAARPKRNGRGLAMLLDDGADDEPVPPSERHEDAPSESEATDGAADGKDHERANGAE